ncbi:hypothetical protein EDB92DRAFT_2055965 [Lactarius akahatsu]|uniref:HNH nuclease domain-containing protein n=1 Tax=Lactarius akahatsu TaxID=416441 RepID=A0AAD4L5T9_9AGAM|nr:hypothetical protein EDB92DRAFT_2055965 [Lactarius akahatsu]
MSVCRDDCAIYAQSGIFKRNEKQNLKHETRDEKPRTFQDFSYRCHLSERPYKWICYAIRVVIGAEGVLSTSHDSLDVVDNDAALLVKSAVLYYHISNKDRTSGVLSARRGSFFDEVAERDGGICLLTGLKREFCDAVHLLPHRKGDMARYSHFLSLSSLIIPLRHSCARDDVIEDINSIKNGVFLNVIAHGMLGIDLVLLMTPNFAMSTTDIDPTAPPTQKQCISHIFNLGPPGMVPSGSTFQISDIHRFPPAIIFDAVYAGAVLHHFGTQTLKDVVTTNWEDAYSRAMTVAPTDPRAASDEHDAAVESLRSRMQAQTLDEAHNDAHCEPDILDMLTFVPYCMVPPDELQAAMSELRERAEAEEHRRVEEKVEEWVGRLGRAT